MGALQPWHWLILIAVVVLLFGSKRLPDAARSLGKSMRIFKSEVKEMQSEGKAVSPPAVSPAAPPVAPTQPPIQVQSERVEAPLTPPPGQNQSDARPA